MKFEKKILGISLLVLVLWVGIATATMIDNGDGTVSDTETGLMWQQTETGKMNWQNALSYCENLVLPAVSGHDDWRLPDRHELQSLVDYNRYYPSLDKKNFPGALPYYYFSSTTAANNTNCAWLVDFYYGALGYMGKAGTIYVRAVRSIQSETSHGSTVITHGYQFDGNLPVWPEAMGTAIVDRAGSGRIWRYNKDEGKFYPDVNGSSAGEQVLIFDWAKESNNFWHGNSEAVADSLFVALVYAQKEQGLSLDNLHFIGHSRGTVVNSEAVERLLKSGIVDSVDHVTTLDPVWDGSTISRIYDDHDVNENTLGDRGVAFWQGVNRADNYYSKDDCFPRDIDFLKVLQRSVKN